jgi:Na+/H+-dicarboxylate symporter
VAKVNYLFKNIRTHVVIAMIVGTLVGATMGPSAAMFAPLGSIFINLIKMLVIPLVAVALISGAANLGNSHLADKVGVTTLGYFAITSALIVGLSLPMWEAFNRVRASM